MEKPNFERYEHKQIEGKWQQAWKEAELYKTAEDKTKPKCFVLDMFPYPSGDGLHVGHPKGYIATDVFSRQKRMSGYNILHPMGWDAFGLPAEQYALKNKVHPRAAVEKNCARFKEQLEMIGFNYDWSREINTTDPGYYKWTQWIFAQLFTKGLAYQSYEPINWCPSCLTGLANEDLDGDVCERCGTKVEQKPLRQWVLRITDYADRMLTDLDTLDWPHSIKESQRNWIGKSVGAELSFALEGTSEKVVVFTTRPDTLLGVTYVAIGYEVLNKYMEQGHVAKTPELVAYADMLKAEEEAREASFGEVEVKKGMATGAYVLHPITGERIPLWVANYVLSGYGTGAVMAVPAHDTRDFAFAKAYGLPIIEVISGDGAAHNLTEAYVDDGILLNSGEFNGRGNREASSAIVEKANGHAKTQYRLKDWVFARQRYWGEPMPIVFRAGTDEAFVVDTAELPVALPNVESYEPTGTGESPIAAISDWVNVEGYLTAEGTFKLVDATHPAPEGVKVEAFRRETNTMPQWAGSSWYYLRYIDPQNDAQLVDPALEKYWSPVDMYVGGAEHATRHLIYARFWHKFLFDIGVVSHPEPFAKLQNVGLIMASDGRKMSKRYGNVVNPDDMIDTFGADSLRVYEMFMGPFDQSIAWSTDNMVGARRFIERVWKLANRVGEAEIDDATSVMLHQTIAKVGADIAEFKFNTAIAQLMICLNHFEKLDLLDRATYMTYLQLIAPFAPHATEELWSRFGGDGFIHASAWPRHDERKLIADRISYAVQVNGKLRDTFEFARDADRSAVEGAALQREVVKKWIPETGVKKVIVVPNKIVNIVV